MVRLVWILLFVLLLAVCVHAPPPGGVGESVTRDEGEAPESPEDQYNSLINNPGTAASQTFTYQGNTYHAGTVHNEDGSWDGTVDTGQGSFTGEGMVFDDDGNVVSCVSGCNLESGDVSVEGGVGWSGEGDSFTVGSVDQIQVGDIRLTNGVNVNFDDGRLCAEGADTLTEPRRVMTEGEDFCVDSSLLDVTFADSVRLRCPNKQFFLAEDVEDTEFSLDGGVGWAADTGSEMAFRDCGGVSGTVSSVCDNNRVDYDGDSYELACASLNVSKDGVRESVFTNGTADVSFHAREIECMTLAPFSKYEYHKDNLSDFAFQAWRAPHKICFKRWTAQALPVCESNCTTYDLLSQVMQVRGAIDYQRYFFQNDSHGPFATVFESSGGSADLYLDLEGVSISELKILTDNPPYYAAFSSLVQLHELETDEGTHRFLEINQFADPSTPKIHKYSTEYGDEVSYMDYDGVFTHAEVTVLPPGQEQDLLEEILGISVLYGLVLLPFVFRRGQISLFLIIGIVVAMFLALIVVMWQFPSLSIGKPMTVEGFVSACLEDVGTDAVLLLSRQGGHYQLQDSALGTEILKEVPSNEEVEKRLAEFVEQNLGKCINGFKAMKGVVVSPQADPKAHAILSPEAVAFSLEYPVEVSKGDSLTRLNEFGAAVPTRLRKALAQTRSVISSRKETGYIDVDVLPPLPLVFFPFKDAGTLMGVSRAEPLFFYGLR